MKSIFFSSLLICVLSFFSAGTLIAQKTEHKKPVSGTTAIKTFDNGIKLNIKGFKVKEATLYFDDDTKVPADNKVDLNQRINMLIIIDSGWTVENEKVYLGGSELIKLNTGAEVLKSDDLFKDYDETGVSPEDAKYVTLKAIITSLDNKKNYLVVTFRIWDKKSTNEITGSYKFYIK